MPTQIETSIDANVESIETIAQNTPAAPAHHLIVIHPFASFKKGELITDGEKIADVLAGENVHHCNRVFPS
jgi:hypothetical protein